MLRRGSSYFISIREAPNCRGNKQEAEYTKPMHLGSWLQASENGSSVTVHHQPRHRAWKGDPRASLSW